MTGLCAASFEAVQPVFNNPMALSDVGIPVWLPDGTSEHTVGALLTAPVAAYLIGMDTRHWIKSAERQGWKVSGARGLTIALTCAKHGCSGSITVPMENLDQPPEPCGAPHFGQYADTVYDRYRELVADLVHRRQSLGLSQEDVGAASGLADGHVNKLEAFVRTAQLPTLRLWAETLGLQLALLPVAMPAETIAVIELQPAPLRKADKPTPRNTSSIGEQHDFQTAK